MKAHLVAVAAFHPGCIGITGEQLAAARAGAVRRRPAAGTAAALPRQPAAWPVVGGLPPAVHNGRCLANLSRPPCWSAEVPTTPLCTDPLVAPVNHYCLACGKTDGHRAVCVAQGGSACMVRPRPGGPGACAWWASRAWPALQLSIFPALAPPQDGTTLIPLCTDPSLSPAAELRDGCPVSLTSGGELHYLRSKEAAPPVGDGVAQCATPGGRGGRRAGVGEELRPRRQQQGGAGCKALNSRPHALLPRSAHLRR